MATLAVFPSANADLTRTVCLAFNPGGLTMLSPQTAIERKNLDLG